MTLLYRDKYSKDHWDFILKLFGLEEKKGEEILMLEVKAEGVVRYYPDKKENEIELLGSNEQEFDKANGYQ